MASITDTITEYEGKVLELLDNVQAPVVDIVKQAAATIDGVLPDTRYELPEQVPAASELVDLAFDFAQKLLADQRDFVAALLDAASPLLPAHAKPAPKVAKPKPAAAA
jgi:hypothetical protein